MPSTEYLDQIVVKNKQLYAELEQLRIVVENRALSALEQRAAERVLYLAILSALGIAKHWAKKPAWFAPQDAYQAFEILVQKGNQPMESLTSWRKVIGLRNALVHDYLNTDPEIVRSVIGQGYYEQLFTFAEQGIDWLAQAQ
ncbi:type VII toxin-antitoxin system HepT family RNase toxin [Pantoea sp. A4]|uniref:type VII toxin-antitoxin system HepT family RNase toxin n=1 Tax=Pantoea sp. A4 TaxID=1225184 RepID=UPI00037EA23C|nr:DUF86 domain-containing protein [Pantoea sp. A4]